MFVDCRLSSLLIKEGTKSANTESTSSFLKDKSPHSPLHDARRITVESKDKTSPNGSHKSSGSPLLDHVKRMQTEALSYRTAKRVNDIMDGSIQRGGEANFPLRLDGGEREDAGDDDRDHRSPPTYQTVIERS
jgi:hypothetical protein